MAIVSNNQDRASPTAATLATVRETAREGEPDRHAAALLAEPEVRDDLLALAAFSAEVARIPAQVREPMMGEIRLQWWHDAIDGMRHGTLSGHPVADQLAKAVARHHIDPARLHAAVEARLFEIGRGLHDDDHALFHHLDATEGQIFLAALSTSGRVPAADLTRVAIAAGRSYGLARALSRLPALLDKGGFPLPADRLAKAAIEPETLTRDPLSPEVMQKISAIIADLQALAHQQLEIVRAAYPALRPAERNILLPVALVEPYFAAQHRLRNEALRRLADLSPLRRLWQIWRAHRRGRI